MPRKTTLNTTKETKDARINGVPKYRLGMLAPASDQKEDAEAAEKKAVAARETEKASLNVLGNLGTNLLYGMEDAFEGMSDFLRLGPQMAKRSLDEGATNLLGYLADNLGWEKARDFFYQLEDLSIQRQKNIQSKWDYDITGDVFGRDNPGEGILDWQWGNNLSKRTSEAIGEDANRTLEEISQGVGAMLPIVAVSVATGGAGAAAAGGAAGGSAAGSAAANAGLKALQTGLFFAQAAGQATESAGKRGATPKAAFVYGLASGAVEAGTEWLGGTVFGEATGGVAGKILDKISPGVTNKILASTGGRILWTFTNEGVEEIFSDLAQPLLDAGAGIGDLSKETWKETIKGLPETFAIGGTVGILLEGLTSGISNVQNRAKGGSHYNASIRSMQTIANAIQANEAVKASSTSTQQRVNKMETATSKLILNEMQKISNEMQKMTAEQRATLLADAPVLNVYLTEDGHVREDISANLKSQIESKTASNTSETIFDANAEAANLAQVAQQVGQSVKVDTSELNAAERKNFAELLKANQTWSETSGSKTRVVIYTGANESIKAFVAPKIIDNTVYISRESLSKGEAIQKYLHENFGHLSPVTADTEILSELGSNEQLKERAMQDLLQNDNSQGYDRTDLEDLIDRALANEELTDEEAGVFEEYAARLYEFGLDKGSIERIARKNPKGLAKLGSAIKARIEQRRMLNLSDAERSRLQSLRRAERLISQKAEALNNAKQAVAARAAEDKARYFEDRAEYLSLDEKDRAAWLKDHGYTAEDFAPGLLGKNEDVSTLPKKYREEYLAALKEEGKTKPAETKKAAEAGDVMFSYSFDSDGTSKETIEILNIVNKNIEKIDPADVFNEKSVDIRKYSKKSDYVLEVFNEQGNIAQNKEIGDVELLKSGAKSTMMHGFGKTKIAAIPAIKTVIENGTIISKSENYKGKGYDRYIISAYGKIDGQKAIVAVVVKSYQGRHNNKFYLHEAEIIKADASSMTAPQLSVDTVDAPASTNSISQSSENVNPKSEKSDVKFSKEDSSAYWHYPEVTEQREKLDRAYRSARSQHKVDYVYRGLQSLDHNIGILLDETENETEKKILQTERRKVRQLIREISDTENRAVSTPSSEKDSSGKTLSVWQSEYFKNSKVRNENGELVPVYHGTDESFTVFDVSRGRPDMDIQGMFFTPDKADAQGYGGKVKAYYLDIRNPADFKTAFDAFKKFRQEDNAGVKAREYLEELGYDGVIVDGEEYIAFRSEQAKLVDNLSPTSNPDIRFSKVDPRPGQSKVYSKEDAADVISSIMAERMKFGDEHFAIEAGLRKGKTAEATRQLFEYLNTLDPGERGGAALKLADFIVENAITTQVWDDLKVDDEILERDRDIVSLMNGLRHRIDFGPYKADIVHIYDKKRSRGMFLQWGTSQANARRAVGMDQIADLFDEIGVRIESDQHPVEIFSRAMDLYDAAKDELGSVMGTVRLTKYLDEGQVEALKQDIAKDLLRAYDEKGEPSILKTRLDALKEELQQTKASAAAERKIAKVRLSVLRDLRFLRAATNRTYAEKNNIPISANLPSNPAFKGLAKDVASVMRGDNISPQKTREMMVAVGDHLTNGNEIYREWLEAIGEKDSPMRQELEERLAGVTGVDVLREADGAFSKADLTLDEWQAFSKLVKLVKTVYTKYDNFYEDGKRYNLTEATTRYQEITHFAIDSKSTDERAFWRMIGEAEDAYSRTFCTPQVFCERADGYNKDGFYSHYLSRFTIDTLNMEIKKAQAMEKLEAFAKKHKRFDKRLKERIAYDGAGGRKISVGEAMDIWLMSTQENGFLTLTEERGGGVNCSDERGMDTIKGLKFTKESLDALYQSFTAEDREFISLIQEGYKDIGGLREDGNLRMLGFNYGVSGNYYTLVRSSGNMQGNFDASREGRDIQTVHNNSWQKARREQAMVIPLQASDVLEKFNSHVNSVARFWAFGEDMQNFGRIYNKDLSELRNGEKTMRRLLNDLYPTQTGKGEKVGKGEAYLKKLINDIQGVGGKRTTASEITRRLRSGYATAVLGLNLGVSASQLASIPNALPYIDFDVMLKAFGSMRRTEGTAAMDQYSKTALVRSLDKGVVRSEGLVDKVGKVADKTTFLIQKSDRAAITFLWKCAQLQIAKTKGLAVGTEENLKAAGLLLDQINTETQPTYQATDRSLFQRSEHELVKSLAMFQSVPTKQRSMIISAIGEAKALGAQVKYIQKQLQSGNLSTEQKAQYTEQLKDLQERKQQSKPKVARAISGVILAQAVYAAVRMGVGRLLHQKDDEPVGEDFLERTKDAMISIFPIFKELYEGLIKGNELEETTLSMVNNLISGVKSIYDADKPEQRNKALLDLGYNAFMILGLPAKNVRNIIVGAIKYSPDAYDRLEEPFQVATTKKMTTALDRGDYDFAADLAVRIMADKGLDISKEQGRLLADLYSKNYSLPSGTITQYTVDGTTYKLTDAEKANFSLVYGDAGSAADELIGKSGFAKLSDSGKDKALSTLYSYYRDKAKTEAVGIDASKLYLMGTAVGADTLALILAQIQDLLDKAKASGKDYNRKELITAFLKRQDLTAVQKYMVMGYLGYKNKNGSDQVRAYINKMKLTKKEKQALYEASGY